MSARALPSSIGDRLERGLGLAPLDVAIAATLSLVQLALVLTADTAVPAFAYAALALLSTISLARRRQAPLTVLTITLLSLTVLGALDGPDGDFPLIAAALYASFTVGVERSLPVAAAGPALVVSMFTLVVAFSDERVEDLAFVALFFGGAWAAGQAVRTRTRDLIDQTAALEARRDILEREAVAAERTRIARELHDIVAHSIGVVVIQAQAARRRLTPVGDAELGAIEVAGREAMNEMRHLLGVLRPDGRPLALAPQPGLEQLPDLLDRVRRTGTDVTIEQSGALVRLAPGLDLTVYRIVQEALTNACKHAPGADVSVAITFGDRDLDVLVLDTGSAPRARDESGGYGLVGLRERVALYGGALEVRQLPEGGFRVHARLPLRDNGQ